jgi:hypothetical protein
MKKVFNKYFGMLNLYPEAKLGICSLTPKVMAWVAKLFN